MSSLTINSTHSSSPYLPNLLRRAWAFNWPLTLTVLVMMVLLPVVIVASFVDPRVITGMPAWNKPLKFVLSIMIYGATLLWLLSLVQGRRFWVQVIASTTGFALLGEIGLIIMQVMRNTTSHFNISTPFDAAVFNAMGLMITVVAVLNLLLAIFLIFQRMPDAVFAWGLRLAVLIAFAGMMTGFLMTSQSTGIEGIAGAHSVGVPDGGAGLPLLGWSTEGGDLRIGHFIGLHSIQVLPLVGWLLTRPDMVRRFSLRRRMILMWSASLGYLGLMLLTIWQALRGQSIIAPDALTLSAFGVLVGALVIVLALVTIQPKRTVA